MPALPPTPIAFNPRDQPTVNQLTDECRALTRQLIGARDQSPAVGLAQRVHLIYTLTGITLRLNQYLQNPPLGPVPTGSPSILP
jgi:hypothetical protein